MNSKLSLDQAKKLEGVLEKKSPSMFAGYQKR